ncbi:cell division control protein 48 homolog C-like [Cannabis sativa]|uniref:cell division control protein 48 homolog C-like n=1 Tax=Cannabis sativa TaxID=3483 RepID=UPI0029CA833E|nr:cell division control protein 48 homolog C-like [Cannabis sativa]
MRQKSRIRAREEKVLGRRLQSFKNLNSSTVDEIADDLQFSYPEYKRQKRPIFMKLLHDVLEPNMRHEERSLSSRKKYKRDVDDGNIWENNQNCPSVSDVDSGVVSMPTSTSNLQKKEVLELDLPVPVSEVKVNLGFEDLGGIKGVLKQLEKKVLVPLYQHQLLQFLGVRPISGLLLHGPPGCGKTKLAHAIANQTGLPFYNISATEFVSGVSGESEENIRELFQKAHKTAPSIIFIDEIDAVASKRENLQKEMERRIVTQLMTCMDAHSESKVSSDDKQSYVLVIGATNRPNAIDPALRRPGRFEYEIELGVPDENARAEILSVLTRTMRLEDSFDLLKIARATPGFVAADLKALASEAGHLVAEKLLYDRKSSLCGNSMEEDQNTQWLKEPVMPEVMEKISITMADFEEAIKIVQPSTRREGFSTIPNVKWEDVGGLDHIRKELDRYIVSRIKYHEKYKRFGVNLDTGILLYGPPGCGKTLIAQAVAKEAGANFIHIKGPELLNKYVGESESAVRMLFSRARMCSPCILFFDEVDALTKERGKEGSWVTERLLNQLLTELDGVDKRQNVFVIGATNRPDVMDKASLRPGRFGKHLYVSLPTPDERGLILKALTRDKPLDETVDLNAIGRMKGCDNFSGADLHALVNEAALAALEDFDEDSIKTTHFDQALTKISSSVAPQQRQCTQLLSKPLQSNTRGKTKSFLLD